MQILAGAPRAFQASQIFKVKLSVQETKFQVWHDIAIEQPC